ncbi:hypothetical protein [Lewinella sp. IMCC34191]|uniref:hypothetical protein n=1 Tax=Lewinella sp. IMCC34191 TaxID=2259172 RepID=UPI0013002916|nr:hypothetical protein [Lewinella sp. IMCC34191]
MSYPSLNRLLYLLFLPLLALACEKETIQPAQNLPGQSEQRVCRITEIPYGNSIYLPDTVLTEYDTLRFVYTDDGKLLTADRYEGGQVTFSYEGDRVAGAVYTVPEYAVEFVGIYSYDDEGLLREVRYPNWYTSPRRGESRLEVDSFFYDDTGRRTGMSTWAEVDDHLFTGYVPVVERSYTYDASGNIPQVIELEYYSTQYEGRQANRRVTTRTGFTVYRSLLFESPLRDHHLYAISPYLHEREEFIVTDPRGNRKSYGTADFVFTPEYIIPEGYYTWSRPYTCFGE